MAIFMTVITTRISNELDIIHKAIESYIEEKADLLIALSCIEKR